MGLNIQKFSWSEMVSNGNGKTSGTAFAGLVISMVGTLCFLLGCLDKMFISSSIDVITQSIIFVGIGTSLLGLRKYVDSKKPESETPSEPESSNEEELIKG
jgi:hypothetical protein